MHLNCWQRISIVILLSLVSLSASAHTEEGFDKRITIIAPKKGQIFHSGEVLPIGVKLDAELSGKRVFVNVATADDVPTPAGVCNEEMNKDEGVFKAKCPLPLGFTGSINIFAFVANTPPPWQGSCGGSVVTCIEQGRKDGVTVSAPVRVQVHAD